VFQNLKRQHTERCLLKQMDNHTNSTKYLQHTGRC
jgi:hypothetical protein